MTSPLKETAGIACPTALLLRVHHSVCTLLGLISDSVPWHRCDTFYQLLLDSSDCCVGVIGCFVDKPIVRISTRLKPLLLRLVGQTNLLVFFSFISFSIQGRELFRGEITVGLCSDIY